MHIRLNFALGTLSVIHSSEKQTAKPGFNDHLVRNLEEWLVIEIHPRYKHRIEDSDG
jgi:hypothetical protein